MTLQYPTIDPSKETVMPLPQLFQRLGISHPVFQAPIGAIASAELAAAVAEADGVGHLACTWRPRARTRSTRRFSMWAGPTRRYAA
jgi:nitronate monooxygenase